MKRCTLELQTIEIYGNDTMNILKKVDILRISEAERLYDFEVFHFHEIDYSYYLVYSHISYFTTNRSSIIFALILLKYKNIT